MREICSATAAGGAYRPEFKPRFESDDHMFRVTLSNMKYGRGDLAGAQVGAQVASVLDALGDGELSAAELMQAMGLSGRSNFHAHYLKPALESGLVERAIPDKPNSRLQRRRRARGA